MTSPTSPQPSTRPSLLATRLSWTLQVVVAVILLQTLRFKFTAAEESVYIFTTVGMEPWGRLGSGAAEAVAGVLLFIPALAWLGALISLGVISGALFFHLTVLGIEVQGDGGLLFAMAVLVFLGSAAILALRIRQWPWNILRKIPGLGGLADRFAPRKA